MSDETKRIDSAKERVREIPKEPVKPRPKETDFDKLLERSKLASQLLPQTQAQSKVATEQAIHEATKQEERRSDDGKRDDADRKDGRDAKQKSERSDTAVTARGVVAKGKAGKEQGGSGGKGEQKGGFSMASQRREMQKILSRSGVKSVPVDLKGKFAQRLSQAMQGSSAADRAAITQQILNKIVQYVRIGINRKGEKEMQIDLHGRLFKGLKLRVVARGGKVGVHFRTADSAGKTLFEKNAGAIKDALAKKGIDVDEIVVS